MKRYFVKSYFTGWHEVPKENYERYVENIMQHANAISNEKKAEYAKTKAKIIDTDECTEAVLAALNRI